MELIARELDRARIGDIDRIDGHFTIDSQLLLHAEANQIHYTVVDLPPITKRYAPEILDYSAYIDDPARAVYLAYVDGTVAGHIILRTSWNNYAYVEVIAVDGNFRRLGVGAALIKQAKEWARQRDLPGIMLETQTNNVQACKFYERCGFKIGGFDNLLYRALDGDTDEVAIYWYYLFEE